jgi:oligopeptide transport system substrate-binding protein
MKKVMACLLSLCLLLGGVAMAESSETSELTYTYDLSLNVFPTNWNPHQYKTNTENDYMLRWITDSFFDFDYNETEDGYAQKPHMTVGEPVDVTADYVGEEWGIKEGEEGRAWKYTLRDNLKWQDGTPINAQTYVTSVKLQLNPKAQNYRADSLYSGSFVVHNAEAYLKQGVQTQVSLKAYADVNGLADVEALLAAHGDEKGYINWNSSYGDTYDFENKKWTGAAEDAIVETPLTVKELYEFFTTGEGATFCTWADEAQKLAWAPDELFIGYTYPELDFEKVGVKAPSENEVVFIVDKPMSGFQLKYNLDVMLVHEEMYNACASEKDGVYTNTYGTTAETTMSYGPYMLTSFQSDKEYTLAKNPNWYGYSLPENEGCYQTTNIRVNYVSEDSTAMEMFLNGQLDEKGLSTDYLPDYATSDYTYYSEGASVFAMALNPHLENLTANQKAAGENINKTILTIKEFRMALSLGMDRAAFIAATNPSGVPAFALYGNTIVGDPENAIFYRDTDAAKQVVVDFWGLTDEVGEGKQYPTNDDAIASITGYNPEMAVEYFNIAYDKAVEQGLIDDDDVVEIIIGLPATTPAYSNGYEFIVNQYTELVKGTKLEGRLTFKKDDTVGNGFGDALRSNQVDMLFYVGWSGAEFDPYSLIEAYVSNAYQYDPCWDSTTSMLQIELDGVKYEASVYEWYQSINGTTIKATNVDTKDKVDLIFPYSRDEKIAADRLQVLAALENAVLQNYDFIPLTGEASAILKSMQIEYHTEEEVFPMGFGGIKYMTYNYDDASWESFVAEQGGTLNYK